MLEPWAEELMLSITMPLTLNIDPAVARARESRMPDGKPLLISKLSMHPFALPFVQLNSIPRKSLSFAVEKLGLKISVSPVASLVVELVERSRGPKNEAFIVVPVKPAAKRVACPLTDPAKYSSPEEGLVK